MIVKDKEKTIISAHEITLKIINIIRQESLNFEFHDDPAEQIYLNVHIISNVLAEILISLTNYGKIYNIDNLNIDGLKKWINIITDEYINIKKDLLN